jgi:Type I phosphodiesterase / nucleotide pyrophosphatase
VPGSICDVLPSAAALLGVPGAVDRLGLGDQVGPRRRVVAVLVDGLGDELLPLAAPHAPLLASVLAGRTGSHARLECTFPSTTPTSLVSLSTGVLPGDHGVLGFRIRIPETQRVLNHIQWRGEPAHRAWQPVQTWFERTAAAGVGCAAVLPAAFAGSGLTEAVYRGAQFYGVRPGEDYAARLAAHIGEVSGLVFGYTSVLDTAAHVHGVDSAQWRAAAAQVDALLSRVLAALPSDAALLVTADHGALDIAPDARLDVDSVAALRAGVDLVTGEPRVRYLHTAAGAADDVVAAWRATLGGDAQVLHRDEAIAAGYFGPVRHEHLARIGDVVVICTADIALFTSAHEPPEVAALVGFHGARTRAEVAIPLLTFAR